MKKKVGGLATTNVKQYDDDHQGSRAYIAENTKG
jgi:hypothetical protein